MDGEVEEGQIRDAHELGMTSAELSTLAVSPVSPPRICLINGHHGEGRVPVKVRSRGSWATVAAMFKTCLTAAARLLAGRGPIRDGCLSSVVGWMKVCVCVFSLVA